MKDTWELIKNVVAVVAPLTTGAGFWAWLIERRKTRVSPPAEMATSQAAIADALSEQFQAILTEHGKDRTDLRKTVFNQSRQIAKQGRQITKLIIDVAECNKHHRACEDNLAYVRGQIAQMMADAPASTLAINPHPLKDQLDVAD